MTTSTDLAEAKRLLLGTPQPVLAAVSGGLDSMCLLHLLAFWGRQQGLRVTAAHFNHGLRGRFADRDEAFVKEVCETWGIPFVSGRGDTRTLAEREGLTIEEAGRKLRYEFLERARRENGCAAILTAHHADDNAETLLLNLLRGTGLQGLTGIPQNRDGILRPFLSVTREQLRAYGEENAVPHVEDETNEEDDAARNLLRHQVLPVLKELNPRAVENMNRTAALLAQDGRALEITAGRLLHEADVTPGERASLPLAACEKQHKAILSRAVLSLLVSVGEHRKDLTARHVEAVLDLLRAGPGRELSLPYGVTARRTETALLMEKTTPAPEARPIAPGETVRFGSWTVRLSAAPEEGAVPIRSAEDLAVTPWRPSDRMTLPGARGSRSLKRLCADAGIPPALRDRLPVLRAGKTPAAVPGIGTDVNFVPRAETAALYVTFHQETEENSYEK